MVIKVYDLNGNWLGSEHNEANVLYRIAMVTNQPSIEAARSALRSGELKSNNRIYKGV